MNSRAEFRVFFGCRGRTIYFSLEVCVVLTRIMEGRREKGKGGREGSEKEGALPLRLFKCEAFGCLRRRHASPSHLQATRIGISVNKANRLEILGCYGFRGLEIPGTSTGGKRPGTSTVRVLVEQYSTNEHHYSIHRIKFPYLPFISSPKIKDNSCHHKIHNHSQT